MTSIILLLSGYKISKSKNCFVALYFIQDVAEKCFLTEAYLQCWALKELGNQLNSPRSVQNPVSQPALAQPRQFTCSRSHIYPFCNISVKENSTYRECNNEAHKRILLAPKEEHSMSMYAWFHGVSLSISHTWSSILEEESSHY